MEIKNNYINSLITQKKRTIITRKEKIKLLNNFIIEQKKSLDLISILENEIEKLNEEITSLKKSNKELSQKYKALSNSKLGKITLKYWKYKKKRVK
ncbi:MULTISPECIES: hypothetical protein [Clostridium]|uniref:Uncharacterized protein n=1 Tax=Clostridium tertium TaxID=1559 RepID=A0A9X3XNF4_9CLOT|nr:MULTISPECIES: hypothetical protein [Clostridium]MDC4240152.1 hypothetical protein [Clostridium tertium]MDU2460616.1 hypothetical protein [Clostridium sp.]MDU7363207.1 hypothetical protein [Clostridium sp.]